MEEDKYLKIYESTNLVVQKYQDRLMPIYIKMIGILILCFGLFSYFYLDILTKVELNLMTENAEAFADIIYGILVFTILGASSFLSYAYFFPESNIFKPVCYDYEQREILITGLQFSLHDFDDLFLHIENKISSGTNDDYVKRYYILKSVFEEHIFDLLEKENNYNFKSRYLNLFL